MIGQAFCRLPCILVIKKVLPLSIHSWQGSQKILIPNPTITHAHLLPISSTILQERPRVMTSVKSSNPSKPFNPQLTMPPTPSTPAADVRALIDLTHTTQTL